MIACDTSVWIDYLRGGFEKAPLLRDLIERREVLAIECVFAELLQGARRDRDARVLQEYWHSLPKVDESGFWMAAGHLAARERFPDKGVGLIDAMILVSARKTDSKVWTLDGKLLGVVPKSMRFEP